MRPTRLMRLALILPLLLGAQPRQDGAPATQETEPAEVSRLVERITAAYDRIQSLRLEATVSAQYDAAGRNSQHELKYSAALVIDGRFRHDIPDELVVAGDDEAVYVYFSRSLRYYRTPHAAAATQPSRPTLPPTATRVLMDHNPFLLLALSEDAAATLRSWGPLTAGEAAASLVQKRADGSVWTFQFDEESGLLREVLVDESAVLTAAGVPSVAVATRRIAYTSIQPNGQVTDEAVAFAPPELAQEVEPATAPAHEQE